MSIKDHNLPMLNTRNDWTDWINSIEDLAVRNDVWNYCDPEGIENLVFTVTKPPDSANKDTIQRFHSLQAIYNSEKKKYDKVSERIDITVCQEFKQHYIGIHTVCGKIIALAESIQPTAKDQKHYFVFDLCYDKGILCYVKVCIQHVSKRQVRQLFPARQLCRYACLQ